MQVHRHTTQPFDDQKPGTSGLRKQVTYFSQPHYLENFVQSIFDVLPQVSGATLVLGGDGRYHNDVAIQTILQIAAANGVARVIVGQYGLLSTPACSHLIRKYQCDGGIILSASHNPGGPEGDFGIKFNGPNGGPAPESITSAIYDRSREIEVYYQADLPPIDVDTIGSTEQAGMTIDVIDGVSDYVELMRSIFDFELIKSRIQSGLSISYDAMHAVTGPYAKAILIDELGLPSDAVINAEPKSDFGGGHPDPNPAYARTLIKLMNSDAAPDIGAASDGDGDRHMILGRQSIVAPSDSLAILLANAHLVPAYETGVTGVARSMPTSRAVDVVAKVLSLPCYETPTGWKFFGNLLDADKITFCGEESAGAGSNHVREKDGVWAILMWLNILAKSEMTVNQLVEDHWRRYGRHYYSRHDFEGIDKAVADQLYADLTERLPHLAGSEVAGLMISRAEVFSYQDPIDQSLSANQGIIIELDDGARVVYRLSGTGTVGATLRIYLEKYTADPSQLAEDTQTMLTDLIALSREVAKLSDYIEQEEPDVIT